jgi:hypothetical protein
VDIYSALHNNLHIYYKTDDLAIYAIYNNKISAPGQTMASR